MPDKKAAVAVLGLGYSKITRGNATQSLGDDAIEACAKAIVDAGLEVEDIDGITSYKYRPDYYDFGGAVPTDDLDGSVVVSPQYIWRNLRFPNLRWGEWNDKFIGSTFIEAHNAIAGGACRYALVWRACNYESGVRYGHIDPDVALAGEQFTLPYGQFGPSQISLLARRYYDKYGATREQMATLVSTSREHALLSGRGYWAENRPEKLTTDDYLSARMIADPLCLYDCDIPVQGCVAFVLGPAEAAQDVSHGSAFVKGFAQGYVGPGGSQTFSHKGGRGRKPFEDGYALEVNIERGMKIAQNLWQSTGLSAADISTANVYDGYSFIVWCWLEALGFCKEGEAAEFIQDGNIGLGGRLPLNTSGGNLGEGRLHGAPHLSESILQAMGRAGQAQVPNARYTLAALDRVAVGQVVIFSSERE